MAQVGRLFFTRIDEEGERVMYCECGDIGASTNKGAPLKML